MAALDFLYPDYEVVRNFDKCINCRLCEPKSLAFLSFYANTLKFGFVGEIL